jgi:MFS family permease
MSFRFFVLYLNNTIFTRVYSNQYHLDTGIVGICYLPFAIGAMLGGIFGGRFSDRVYNASVAKAKEKNEEIYPEMRLNVLVLGCSNLIQALALIAYGWCIHKDVHLAYGLVCQFICKQMLSLYALLTRLCLDGLASMAPNVTISAYMVDCFRKQGASVTGKFQSTTQIRQ